MEDNVIQNYDSSNVNPLALLFLVVTALVMLQARRQAAVKALLAIAAFIPLGQQVVVLGLHLHFFRILIVIGFTRLLSRGETGNFKWNQVDKLFVAWVLVRAACGGLREPGSIMGVHCLAGAFNAFGTYYLVRSLIKEPAEVLDHLRFFALAAIIIGVVMLFEFVTHRNPFAVFGGVPAMVIERDGRFRCQGPFEHPILAGTFAATLFPLLAGLWLQSRRDRKLALGGVAACTFISTVAAASSGALLTCVTAMAGLALWPLRTRMHLIRRGAVAAVIGMSMMMQAPVWYLLAKASNVLGGTGWHRAYLIDQAIRYFGEWCLIGTSVTAHWAPAGQVLTVDPNNMDITNHYVEQGVLGGGGGLGLFLATIVTCFKVVGCAVRAGKSSPSLNPKMLWALGVSLACHCTAFISISYFDQMEVFYFWLLAVIATIAATTRRQLPSTTPQRPVEGATATHTHTFAVP